LKIERGRTTIDHLSSEYMGEQTLRKGVNPHRQ
jgi:hypothetical protein